MLNNTRCRVCRGRLKQNLHYYLLFNSETSFRTYETAISFCFYRLVYKWFYFLYILSYVLGIISYVIGLATFFGVNLVFDVKGPVWMDCALLFLCYGIYFGVLGRDVAEICADTMASHVGVRTDSLFCTTISLYFKMPLILFAVLCTWKNAHENPRRKCLCRMR